MVDGKVHSEPCDALLKERKYQEGCYVASQFNMNLPCKYYYQKENAWVFLDDRGKLF